MTTPSIRKFPHGIHAIDTHYVRSGVAASHLIVRNARAAFVDVGANSSVPRLLAALETLGLAREDIDYVFITHVHLDHAGGAGKLLQALPNARVLTHPRGAPHLIDPSRLEAGTRAVYGDSAYDAHYGKLIPIPAERVLSVSDGERITLGGSHFEFLYTPGHALHHLAIYDQAANSVFSGDAFGISYRVFDDPAGKPFIFPTTTPTQFDPDQMRASIDRIVALEPQAIYLTHYSEVRDIARLAGDLQHDIAHYVAVTEAEAKSESPGESTYHALRDYLTARLKAHGSAATPEIRETWLAADMKLNASGLLAWYHRRMHLPSRS